MNKDDKLDTLLLKNIPDYSRVIHSLIVFTERKTIVEIGVQHGFTTYMLCEAAKQTGGQVYAIDKKVYEINEHRHNAEHNLKQWGCQNVKFIQADTQDKGFKQDFTEHMEEIDLAFIDGDHSYNGLKNDFDLVYPKLTKDGIIIFHDTLQIDGCREFLLDLHTKYNDGTFDIISLPFGYGESRAGLSILTKRSYPTIDIGIREICGSPHQPSEILNMEQEWYNSQRNNQGDN